MYIPESDSCTFWISSLQMLSDSVVVTRSASLSSIGLLSFSHCILVVASVVNNVHSKVATSPAKKIIQVNIKASRQVVIPGSARM